MNIDKRIKRADFNFWKKFLKENYGIISESGIPVDEETIRASYMRDQSNEKYAPTVEFLEKVYRMFNAEFFNDALPNTLSFKISVGIRARFIGLASYHFNNFTKIITPVSVTLNGSRKMSIHEWLNVILHEMIHIYDYVNYPEHYLGFQRKLYDAHGVWFINFGKQFERYGFNIQKYCNADIELDTDNTRVKNAIGNSVFIVFEGWKPDGVNTPVVKISSKDTDKYKAIIEYRISLGTMRGLKKCVFMRSSNHDIVKLSQLRMRNRDSGLSYYYYTDDFIRKYGPFEEIETMDIMSVNEDRDETGYDEMNRIDDAYAKKIYDNIKGVVNVKKTDDGEYEVDIA